MAFRDAGVYPDMVQVGNEISNGMLWPDGKLPDNWDNFAQLVHAGINVFCYAFVVYYTGCKKLLMYNMQSGFPAFGRHFFQGGLSMYHVKVVKVALSVFEQ